MLIDSRVLLALAGGYVIGSRALPSAYPGVQDADGYQGNPSSNHNSIHEAAGEAASSSSKASQTDHVFEISLQQFPIDSYPRTPLTSKPPSKPQGGNVLQPKAKNTPSKAKGKHAKRNPDEPHYEIDPENIIRQVGHYYASVTIGKKVFKMVIDTKSSDLWVWSSWLPQHDREEMMAFTPGHAFYEIARFNLQKKLQPSLLTFDKLFSRFGRITGLIRAADMKIGQASPSSSDPQASDPHQQSHSPNQQSTPPSQELNLPNQPFACILRWDPPSKQSKRFYGELMDGIIGLGLSRIGSSVALWHPGGRSPDPRKAMSIVERAFERRIISKPVFTIDLYRHDHLNPAGKSKLVIGKCLCDSERADGSGEGWVDAHSNSVGHWLLRSGENPVSMLATGYPYIGLEESRHTEVVQYYSRAQRLSGIRIKQDPLPGWGKGFIWWYCNEKNLPAFIYRLAGKVVVIPGSQMIHTRGYYSPQLDPGGREVCIGSLQFDARGQNSIIGSPFFLSYTVCFDEGEWQDGLGHTVSPKIKWCPKKTPTSAAAKTPYPPRYFWGGVPPKETA